VTRSTSGVTIGGIVSIHSPAFDGLSRGPYLDRALGGTVPGFSVALSSTSEGGAHLTVEATSTASFEVVQKGRFVTGAGPEIPAVATYRDTMLSVLPGVHCVVAGLAERSRPREVSACW
jgi:hypothetical protein